jgi:xanthine dehydrogenase large subunit
MMAIEEILARGRAAPGLPADLVRERNFYRPGDRTHYGEEVEGADRIERSGPA